MHNRNESIEEYLEAMYRLRERKLPIGVAALASGLGVSRASASQMTGKLRRLGLASHDRYGRILLTKKGEALGRKITGRHRLIERFLAFLGLKKGLHEEACRLEHAVSGSVEKKMREALGGRGTFSVAGMEGGMRAKIVSIEAEPAAARRLGELGLTPGTTIALSQKAPFRGAVEISVRGSRLAIGRKLALRISARRTK